MAMKYVYGALLLHSAEKPITEENLAKVVTAAGIKVEEVQVKALVAALSEVNISEALKSAMTMTAAPAVAADSPDGPRRGLVTTSSLSSRQGSATPRR